MLDKLYRPVKGIRSKDRRATQWRGEDFIILNGPNKGKKMYKDVVWRPYHLGIDYAWPNSGDSIPIYAAHTGIARLVEDPTGFWHYIVIDGWDFETYYGHLKSWLITNWQQVKANQEIGLMGSSGNSTAVHLHFGLRLKDRAQGRKGRIDPSKYIAEWNWNTEPLKDPNEERFKTLTANDVAALNNLIDKKAWTGELGDLDKRMLLILARSVYQLSTH